MDPSRLPEKQVTVYVKKDNNKESLLLSKVKALNDGVVESHLGKQDEE